MNHTKSVLVAIVVSTAGLSAYLAAGPLAPPAGPVASTYKTLAEVEPRIAINATNTPGDADSLFKITQPGSYYLTGNITGVTNKAGIEIASNNVSIDLGGFSMLGVAGAHAGIATSGVRDNLSFRNGKVIGWPSNGIHLAVNGSGSDYLFEGITVASNGYQGIMVGANAVLRDCIAQDNQVGFVCSTNANVSGCVARSNTERGFELVASANISNCSAQGNGGDGFRVVGRASVQSCISESNLGDGFSLGGVGSLATHCVASNNAGCGFRCEEAGASVVQCVAEASGADGIQVWKDSTVRDNTARGNGTGASVGAGVHTTGNSNRIEGNHCIAGDQGVYIQGKQNIIVRNTCAANSVNWNIAVDNIYGPIHNLANTGAPAVFGNGASQAIGTEHPNANFTH